MRRPVSVAVAALLLTAAPAARAGDSGRTARPHGPTATAPLGPVDAGLLADLDLLDTADYRRDREVAGRQGLLERLRLLEAERARARGSDSAAGAAAPGTTAAPPAPTPGATGATGKDPR